VNNQVKHFLLLVGTKLLRVPLAILVLSLLSRLIGPEGVGQWSMLVAASTFFHSFFLNWTQAPSVRFGREEWVESNNLSKTWAARRPLVLLGLFLAVLFLVLRPFSFFERITSLPSEWWPLAVAYLFGLWWLAEVHSLLNVTCKFAHLAVFPLASDALAIVFLFFMILTPNEGLGNWVITGVVVVTTLFWGIVWVREFIYTRSLGESFSLKKTMRVISYGWPMIPTFVFGYLSDWGDHLLLQHFHGAQQVGFFHAGYQVMVAMVALASPLAVVFLPKLIDGRGVDQNAESDYICRIIPAVATLWLLAIIPCIAVVPWVFAGVFGEEFLGARPAFYVLITVVPCAVFPYLYTVLFSTQGRLGRAGLFQAIMFAVNISVSLMLIPQWGCLGAAIGTAVSYLIVQSLYIFDQHKYCDVSLSKPATLFLIALFYSLIQLAIEEQIVIRLSMALVTMWALVLIAKKHHICDGNLIASLLPNQFAWVGMIFDRFGKVGVK
jgi:O-antigen/teichoic acid export membrane protein